MALPVEIVTRTVTYGPETDFQGNAVTGTLTFVPSEDITWVAAGQGLHVKPITVGLNSSGSGSVDLICTDQAGFRNANGQTITNWYYTVSADLVGVAGSTRKFVVPSGAGSLDLDTMIPITTGSTTLSIPAYVSTVAGRTGAVTLTKNDVGLSNIDNTADASKPVSTATAAALAVKAPGLTVATTVTTAGALVVNNHNPVDATTGNLTMTLPTGQPAGTTVVVEKTDSTTNTVTVSGNIRGVGSSTLVLALTKESIEFLADAAGSWWPIAGHKTLGSLDTRYRSSVLLAGPGVDPTGTTDSTTAMQAIITAAPYNSQLVLPAGTYLANGLTIPDSKSLFGAGKGDTIIKTAPNVDPTIATVTVYNGQKTTISDIQFLANGYANRLLHLKRSYRANLSRLLLVGGAGSGDGLVIEGVTAEGNMTIGGHYVDLFITDFVGIGLWLKNKAFDSQFTSIYVGYCGTNIKVEVGNGACFWTNLHSCNAVGVGFDNASDQHRIVNAYIESCGDYGVKDTGKENTYSVVRFWNNGTTALNGGVLVSGGQKDIFTACRFEDNWGPGITFTNATRWTINACEAYDRNGGSKHQTYGVVSTGTSDQGSINGGSIMLIGEHTTGAFSLVGSANFISADTLVDATPNGVWRQRAQYSRFGEASTANATISLTGVAGNNRDIALETAGVGRWAIRANNAAETGSDNGSHLDIVALTDAGATKFIPISVNRSSGVVSLTRARIYMGNAASAPATPGAGAEVHVIGNYFKVRSASGVLFDTTPQAAIADTSGATLAALETEVNKLKALLRTAGLLLP